MYLLWGGFLCWDLVVIMFEDFCCYFVFIEFFRVVVKGVLDFLVVYCCYVQVMLIK